MIKCLKRFKRTTIADDANQNNQVSLPLTDDGPDPNSKAKGLVTWPIFFSGVGRFDSVSSVLRRMTGTSNPNLLDKGDIGLYLE